MKIKATKVTATTRKLRAKWTPECAKDLRAFHTVGAERALMGGNDAVHGVTGSFGDRLTEGQRTLDP